MIVYDCMMYEVVPTLTVKGLGLLVLILVCTLINSK